MIDNQQTLFERVGGEQTVAELIDQFYDRVVADPERKPFFTNVSMVKLRSYGQTTQNAARVLWCSAGWSNQLHWQTSWICPLWESDSLSGTPKAMKIAVFSNRNLISLDLERRFRFFTWR